MSLVMEQPAADVPPKVTSTQAQESTQAKERYDPKYDPLKDKSPGHGKEYAPTYWVDTAGAPPEDDGPITSDMDVDVAIIGSGYTGLSTAIHLAEM